MRQHEPHVVDQTFQIRWLLMLFLLLCLLFHRGHKALYKSMLLVFDTHSLHGLMLPDSIYVRVKEWGGVTAEVSLMIHQDASYAC